MVTYRRLDRERDLIEFLRYLQRRGWDGHAGKHHVADCRRQDHCWEPHIRVHLQAVQKREYPFNLFTPKSDQFQISPVASPEITNITQYGELGFSWLTQMTDDHTTNSRLLTCTITFLFKKANSVHGSTNAQSGRLTLSLPSSKSRFSHTFQGVIEQGRLVATMVQCRRCDSQCPVGSDVITGGRKRLQGALVPEVSLVVRRYSTSRLAASQPLGPGYLWGRSQNEPLNLSITPVALVGSLRCVLDVSWLFPSPFKASAHRPVRPW